MILGEPPGGFATPQDAVRRMDEYVQQVKELSDILASRYKEIGQQAATIAHLEAENARLKVGHTVGDACLASYEAGYADAEAAVSERVRVLAEAAHALVNDLTNDWIDSTREDWGNTNANVVRGKRDHLKAALAAVKEETVSSKQGKAI